MEKNKRKFILIAAYNRPKSLDNLLCSLLKCADFHDYKLVITYHEEIAEVRNYLLEQTLENLILLPVCGLGRNALENININRIFGYKYCFELLEADYVIGFEDDVEVGYDTLKFSEVLLNQYGDDPNFRCINLGSREAFDKTRKFQYGKFRYGIFGQGSCIGRRQYLIEKSKNLYKWNYDIGLDGMLEAYYKTGFVIMPFVSRYINDGRGGTHAPEDSNNDYYKELELSFIGTDAFEIKSYKIIEGSFKWRDDCILYLQRHNVYYQLKFFIFMIKITILKKFKLSKFLKKFTGDKIVKYQMPR